MLLYACRLLLFLVLVFPYLLSSELPTQRPRPTAPVAANTNLRQLALKSGYIFQGTVLSVKPLSASGQHDVACFLVTFRVNRGIQGARTGQKLAVREWAGLWTTNDRYRVGEHMVLFLHRPSKLGLTSPVGGPLGRLAVDDQGQIVLDQLQNATFLPVTPVHQPLSGTMRITPSSFASAVKHAMLEQQ